MDYDQIIDFVKDDIDEIDNLIKDCLKSDVSLIDTVSQHITGAPSKKIRPLLVAIIGNSLNVEKEKIYKLGAVIEFIHTATLLHDDVVDISSKRRGKDTANKIWGNEASVLVGDFLYSKSFELMVDLESMDIMEILSKATNRIAKGEVLQLMHVSDINISYETYMKIIYNKTATLFEAASKSTAVLANAKDSEINNLSEYGKNLGIAFQITDDILDLTAQNLDQIGKDIGDDIKSGKITLPLIYSYELSNKDDRELIKNILINKDKSEFKILKEILDRTGAIELSLEKAKYHANEAKRNISIFEESNYKDLMIKLVDFSIYREK
ncbi:MAG: polyprenyl synthetase family protein [Pseudomonadota bacterium]|nr:polyprenyl synthetase family protein [Pseudomonadota bacterium]